MIQDRELLIGIFNAIGALSERLTGDRLVIGLLDSNGAVVNFYSSARRAHWESLKNQSLSEAHVPSSGPSRQELASPRICDIHDQANAKSQAPDLAVDPTAIR
jgi:hypothetical protein